MTLADLLASVGSGGGGGGSTLTCGGEERPDGGAAFGYALARGRRATMEDFHAAEFRPHPSLPAHVGAFGVFDGHGGPFAARFAAARLLDAALAHPSLAADPAAALTAAFEGVDAAYVTHGDDGEVGFEADGAVSPPRRRSSGGEATAAAAAPARDDGCTAVAALLLPPDTLVVAHVGDSRAVLVEYERAWAAGGEDGKQGNGDAGAGDAAAPPAAPPTATATPLSRDHKPDRADERARIEAAGGAVVWAGAWRVGGVLAVSRAIGDAALKPYVTATPDVDALRVPDRTAPDAPSPLLLLASDGVWDVLSNDDAARVAARAAGDAGDVRAAAAAVAKEALARGTADNVSVVAVRLRGGAAA